MPCVGELPERLELSPVDHGKLPEQACSAGPVECGPKPEDLVLACPRECLDERRGNGGAGVCHPRTHLQNKKQSRGKPMKITP
jgi:hypothetical protein